MAQQEEKVEFGVSNVHFFLMTRSEGTWTCGKPELVESCQSLTTDEVQEKDPIYADNEIWYELKNGSMKASLGFVRLLDDFRIKYMGAKKDKNGTLWTLCNPDDIRVGIMFEADTNLEPIRYVLVNGSIGPEKKEYKTVEGKVNATTSSLEIDFEGIKIGGKKTCHAKVSPGDANYETLFSTPFEIPTQFASDPEVA